MKKAGQENVHHLFQCLYYLGVRQIFVCPGSRNAPLINGAIAQKDFEIHSVVDERSAGYMALGAAQVSQKPVVLICTSGTALLNFFPAVAEAHQMQVPLIILSADRPANLIDRWENQAINQKRVFGKYVNKYIEWKGIMELKRSLGKVERIAAKIHAYTQFPDKGAVHVNFHFSEPLYFPEPIKTIQPFSLKTQIKSHTPPKFPENKSLAGKKIMVLCGSGTYQADIAQGIETLAQKNALVFCDLTSPYRPLQTDPNWELLLNSLTAEQWNRQKPDTLITTGSFLLNKNLKNLIRKNPPQPHIHLADCNLVKDAYFTKPLVCRTLGKDFTENATPDISFKNTWTEQISAAIQKLNQVAENSNDLSDLWAVWQFFRNFPENAVLHTANSMSVRYAAICGLHSNVKVYANRGTSGIDGCVSTAVGAALTEKEKTHYLLCGDLAFFYDVNALWQKKLPDNLKILLLNNAGGNIFDMIQEPAASAGYEFFTTPHKRNARLIAEDFGVRYLYAGTQSEWNNILPDFLDSTKITLLEISTNPTINKQLWNQLKK